MGLPNTHPQLKQRFAPGQTLMTRGVNAYVQQGVLDPLHYLYRHLAADWGDLCEQDKRLNQRALRSGEGRLMSSYGINEILTLWIITECDRSRTTLLLPDEY